MDENNQSQEQNGQNGQPQGQSGRPPEGDNRPEGQGGQQGPQPFDYQQHYRQQNQQQYRQPWNPQQPYGGPNGQVPPPPPQGPQPPVYPQEGTGDSIKVFCILSYVGILWLVGLLTERENPKVRFHVNQGIILSIFEAVVGVAFAIVKTFITAIFSEILMLSPLAAALNGMLSLVQWCVFLTFIIIGILHAARDREEPLPVIGSLFRVL